MKCILYICPYLSIGGTEKHLLDLITGFGETNQLFLLAPPGETAPLFQKQKVQYYPFTRLDQNLSAGLKEFSHQLRTILSQNPIDFIHIHGAAELMFLVRLFAPNYRKVPIIFTVHGFHGELKSWDYWLCARLCNKFAAKVIAVAKAEERILLSKGIRKDLITTVLNGVPDPLTNHYEMPEEIKAVGKKTLIGAVARLETTKGIHFLIEAYVKIVPEYSNTQLMIVGSGSKETELKELVEKLGVEGQVTFTGYRQNVHQYLNFFDIFVIPSLHEAHPLVLMEAMGHGKAIVATTVGGIPEVIKDGENGLLVPPGDADGLGKAISKLMNSTNLQKALGQKARLVYENEFTVKRMLEETERIYKLLNK